MLEDDRLITCGPVVAELLAGTAERDREPLAESLRGIHWAELDGRGWVRAGSLAARLRSSGETVPLTDVFIASAALAVDAELLTADSDFDRVARHESRLRVRHLDHPA